MSEILLQAIVEKLESLEIALLKKDSPGNGEELKAAARLISPELIKLSSALYANNQKINGLSEDIRALEVNSGNRVQNQVKHIHHFHKQVWLSVSLFIISLLLSYGWITCSNEKKSYEANDIKYRYWKTNGNIHLLKIVYQTDSLYNLNKNHFIQVVTTAEQEIGEQQRAERIADEKKKNNKK